MLDLSYMQATLPNIANALWLTVQLSFVGILVAFFIGAGCSIVIFYRTPVFCQLAKAYIAFFRSTPLLLHLFFLYYGLPRVFNLVLSFEWVAFIGLAAIGGSYMAESLRAGLEAVAKTQLESSQAIGLNAWQSMRYVIFPQAFSYSLASLGANCIFLFKETSVFTCIAGTDITTVAISMINIDYKTNEALLMLVFSYIVVLLPTVLLLSYFEKKVRHAEFGY